MWTIKHIYESDFGCEERMPNELLTVLVVLESDTGEESCGRAEGILQEKRRLHRSVSFF